MENVRNPTKDDEYYYKLQIMLLRAKLLVAQYPEAGAIKFSCKNKKVEDKYNDSKRI